MLNILSLFDYQFMRYAFLAGTLFALIAPVIGQFMYVRRLSGVTDSISHVALFSVVVSMLLPPQLGTLGSLVITVIISLALDRIRRLQIIPAETVLTIGLVLSLALVSIIRSQFDIRTNIESLLFGSLLTVDIQDIYLISVVVVLIALVVKLCYSRFFLIAMNEELARLQGVRVGLYNDIFIILSATFIALGISLVGALLVSAVVIIPVASASQYRFGFVGTMVMSIILGCVGVWLGLVGAWVFDISPGSGITTAQVGIFILSSLLYSDIILARFAGLGFKKGS